MKHCIGGGVLLALLVAALTGCCGHNNKNEDVVAVANPIELVIRMQVLDGKYHYFVGNKLRTSEDCLKYVERILLTESFSAVRIIDTKADTGEGTGTIFKLSEIAKNRGLKTFRLIPTGADGPELIEEIRK
jgi:hypothetical protein